MMVLAQHKGLQVQVDVPPHLPLVRASPELLTTAVRNLLDNAIKFTPPGGSVRLSARAVGGQVEIAVSDTGVGISPEELPHIFQRFRRGRRGTGEGGSGAGLGLALVKAIAEGYGGQIKVESRLGEALPSSGPCRALRLLRVPRGRSPCPGSPRPPTRRPAPAASPAYNRHH